MEKKMNYSTEGSHGRNKVREFKRGSIFSEVYEKKDTNTGKTFFDVKIVREFVVDSERKRGPYVQQRDLRDVIVTVVEAMEFISDRHREIKKSFSKYEEDDEDEEKFDDEK